MPELDEAKCLTAEDRQVIIKTLSSCLSIIRDESKTRHPDYEQCLGAVANKIYSLLNRMDAPRSASA